MSDLCDCHVHCREILSFVVPHYGFRLRPLPLASWIYSGAPAVIIISESLPISLRPVGPVCNLTALGRLSGDDEYVGDIEVEEDIDEETKFVCFLVSAT